MLAGSRWNHLFELDGRWVVVNTISMRAAAIDGALATALASGDELADTAAVAALRRLGIAGPDDDDGRRGLTALARRAWAGPILDLFAIGPAGDDHDGAARQLAQLTASIEEAHAAGGLRTVKLRLAGAAHAPHTTELLARLGARCRELGVELISLIMAEALADAPACAAIPVDAYFVRWRPAAEPCDPAALAALRALVARGKLLAIQLAVREADELGAHAAALRALADDATLARNPRVAWDVGLADDAPGAFFLAAVCHHDPARAATLAAARARATELGLPVRPAVAPFHLHPGCPMLMPGAHAIGPSGRRVGCLDELATQPEAGVDPRAASAARADHQLASACAGCATLPLCLARCPKLPAPAPGSPACLEVQARALRELVRLVACGQLRVEPLAAAEVA